MQSEDIPKGSSVYMFLFGNLDDAYLEKLHQQLETLYAQNFQEVVFNFSNVTSFYKSAVEQFLDFYRRTTAAGKHIRIEGVNEYIAELFNNLQLNIPLVM